MLFRTMVLAGVLIGCTFLAACTTTATSTLPNVATAQYRISPGDKLKLAVFREDSLSGEYTVNESGMIGLPMVGDVQAAGKTLSQLREDLTRTLGSEYVRNAKISLDVVDFRPIYILGEVQKPGEYAYGDKLSVMGLVAKAGGFTYRANEKVVFIRHADEATEVPYQLSSGAAVMPGDTVRIEARYF